MTTRTGYLVEQPWLPASESLTDWGDGFHELMLADRIRMTAFETAIRETVRPGAVVLDLGTGTGILARWALEAGAARVYGIDLNPAVLDTARRELEAAGLADRFHPLQGLSFDVELPEPVDLIISEILGNLVDNEDCIRILADARRRFLKPDGQMLPRQAECYLVPVAAQRAHERIRRGEVADTPDAAGIEHMLRERGLGGRFDIYYDTILPQASYLASPRLVRFWAFTPEDLPTYRHTLVFPVQRDGVFTGFKGYFVAALSDTVCLDIAGDDIEGGTTSDSWKHCFLPVATPTALRRHDRIVLYFDRRYPEATDSPLRQCYRWQGSIWRGTDQIARFDHGVSAQMAATVR